MKKLEPLRLSREQKWYAGATAIQSADGKEIARVRQRVDFDDGEVARRFIACVNACAGIPTETLEGFAKLDGDPLYELVRADTLAGIRLLIKTAADAVIQPPAVGDRYTGHNGKGDQQ